MKFTELLKECIANWPENLDISDGKNVCDAGGHFLGLSEAWNQIEKAAEKEGEVESLMAWAIFSAFHKQSVVLFSKGVTTVSLSDLDINYLHSKFNESFNDDENYYKKYKVGWSDDYNANA